MVTTRDDIRNIAIIAQTKRLSALPTISSTSVPGQAAWEGRSSTKEI